MNASAPRQLRRASVVLVVPLLSVAVRSLVVGSEMWQSPVAVILARAGSLAAYRVVVVCAMLVLVVSCLLAAREVYRRAMVPPSDRRGPTQRWTHAPRLAEPTNDGLS
ncbi:hypothetical protein [Halomarina oriensis]|uniref:hypothetical protein n=1 Tax=Halomarina oriensis TaxID=671145 RepID=UPI001303B5E2|nr:hypothetical protein [Halomarina oriensis]